MPAPGEKNTELDDSLDMDVRETSACLSQRGSAKRLPRYW